MTNFEPKKLPPLGPPGRKLPSVPVPPASNPQLPPPPAPNLPPKIGAIPPKPVITPPAKPSFPTAPLTPQTQRPQEQAPEPNKPSWEEEYQQFKEEPQEAFQDDQQSRYQNSQQHQKQPQRGQSRSNSWLDDEEPDEHTQPEHAEETASNKSKKSKPVKTKKVREKKEKKPKVSHFAGSRRRLLATRIIFFGSLAFLVAAGVYSFIPKASYLTEYDTNVIVSKVRADLGETYFPSEAGEGWARGFLEAYLNYDAEQAAERTALLKTYTTEEVLKSIEITFLSDADLLKLTGSEEPTFEEIEAATGITDTKTQVVTEGPYLIKKELLPGNSIGIYSYKVQINGNNWAYIEVPVYYNMEERGLSISGTPTFRSVIPISKPPVSHLEATFENDREVSTRISSDIENYLKAWVSSDQAGIDRYLVKEKGANAVTPQASTGLGGSVDFLSLDKLIVETKPLPSGDEITEAQKADFNKRYVLASVRVIEPTSGIVYRQNYQLVIQYVNENWFVQDIRNMVTFADNSE